jgi:hypothetical protein
MVYNGSCRALKGIALLGGSNLGRHARGYERLFAKLLAVTQVHGFVQGGRLTTVPITE